MMPPQNQLLPNEITRVLDAVHECSGYDFHQYSSGTLQRRLTFLQESAKLSRLTEMIPLVYSDQNFLTRVLDCLSITVTELFRDPSFFSSLRENVFPKLDKKECLKVWHAGCATGEEVYSLAIMLDEFFGNNNTLTYATDFNPNAVASAQAGVYSIPTIKDGTRHYQKAGGTGSLAEYYHCKYGSVKMNESLKKNVTFSHFDLVNDKPFGKMDIVLCRNVMIYFNRELQEKVFTLFANSLAPGGFLCLGSKETLNFSGERPNFIDVDPIEKIYRRL